MSFRPDPDKSYFAYLLGDDGVPPAIRLQELYRNVLNGTSLTDHLLQELHPSDERLAKTLDVLKAGVANNAALQAAFGADIGRLQAIVDAEQVRAGAAYAREAKAFGTAYAIEAASTALGGVAGKVVGKVAPIAIEAAAPSVRVFAKRVGGALSRFSEQTAENVRPRVGIQVNKAAGDAWELEAYNTILPRTQIEIRPQITVRSLGPSGKRVRLDALGKDIETGSVRLSDMKASSSAPFTPNQKVVYPELESWGGVVAGKGKPPYVGSMKIAPTVVDILRKP